MTFLYRLLGIPGNLEEAIEKSSIKGIIPEVVLKRERENSLDPRGAEYKYKIRVKVGRAQLTVSEWAKWFNNYVPGVDSPPASLVLEDRHARNRAYEIAEDLATREGINRVIRINGEFYNLFRV